MLPDLAGRALRAVVRVMGEPITYRRRGEQWPASGVFQASHVALDPETGVQVRSTQPVLLVNAAALALRPQQGDEVEVRGKIWQVRDPQPDGHEGWLLMLHRLPEPAVFQPGVFEAGVFA
jgi:hypothetical protein